MVTRGPQPPRFLGEVYKTKIGLKKSAKTYPQKDKVPLRFSACLPEKWRSNIYNYLTLMRKGSCKNKTS